MVNSQSWNAIVPAPHSTPKPNFNHKKLGIPSGVWQYTNEKGQIFCYIRRFDIINDKNENEKIILPLTFGTLNGEPPQWHDKHIPELRPPYLLQKLATHLNKVVLIVEGEKSADVAEKYFGEVYCVTTSIGGARAAKKTNWKWLKGRDIIIWRDNDADGLGYQQSIVEIAQKVGAKSIRIVQIPDFFPAKWDIADELPTSVSVEYIWTLLQQAVLVKNEPIESKANKTDKADDAKSPAKFINTQDFVNQFIEEGGHSISRDKFCLIGSNKKKLKRPRAAILKYYDSQTDKRNVSRNMSQIYELLQDKIESMREEVWQEKCDIILQFKDDKYAELYRLAEIVVKPNPKFFKTDKELQDYRVLFMIAIEVWIKGIKAKLSGLKYRWPIIPIFWSFEEGRGKSALVEKLCEAFQPFVGEASLDALTDQARNYKLFTDLFVIICEELAGAPKAVGETLKKLATKRDIVARIFHTQEQDHDTNYASLIMTGNSPLALTLNSLSGGRRFLDFKIHNEITDAELDSIDPLKIVQDILIDVTDEQKAETRKKVETYILPVQEAGRILEPIPEFIQMAQISINDDESKNSPIDCTQIYKNYAGWCNYLGLPVLYKRGRFVAELCLRLNVQPRHTNKAHQAIDIDLEKYAADITETVRNYVYRNDDNSSSSSSLKVVTQS